MSEAKKTSFILHLDSLSVLDELSKDQVADLFLAIRNYNLIGKHNLKGLMKAIFVPFENQFIRDGIKYKKIVKRNTINGSLGGRPNNSTKPKKPNGLIGNPTKPKKADSDSDSDSDSEDNNISNGKINFPELLDFINLTLGKNYSAFNQSIKNKYLARLKDGYFKSDIKNAILNASKDLYHKETNYKYLTVEYFSRAKTLDLHCDSVKVKKIIKPFVKQRYV